MKRENYTRSIRLCACGEEFIPTGQNQKYCTKDCQKEYNKFKANISLVKHLLKKGVHVGVGKGGRVGKGKDNPAYKHGFGCCLNRRKETKDRIRYCRDCGKDLIEATHYQWVIHHIDHNKYNNPEDGSNWTLLCKRCHQIEHKCWNAFEGATTRDLSRSSQEGSEMPNTLTIDIER